MTALACFFCNNNDGALVRRCDLTPLGAIGASRSGKIGMLMLPPIDSSFLISRDLFEFSENRKTTPLAASR